MRDTEYFDGLGGRFPYFHEFQRSCIAILFYQLHASSVYNAYFSFHRYITTYSIVYMKKYLLHHKEIKVPRDMYITTLTIPGDSNSISKLA